MTVTWPGTVVSCPNAVTVEAGKVTVKSETNVETEVTNCVVNGPETNNVVRTVVSGPGAVSVAN